MRRQGGERREREEGGEKERDREEGGREGGDTEDTGEAREECSGEATRAQPN